MNQDELDHIKQASMMLKESARALVDAIRLLEMAHNELVEVCKCKKQNI